MGCPRRGHVVLAHLLPELEARTLEKRTRVARAHEDGRNHLLHLEAFLVQSCAIPSLLRAFPFHVAEHVLHGDFGMRRGLWRRQVVMHQFKNGGTRLLPRFQKTRGAQS